MRKIMLITSATLFIYLSAQICGCGSCEANTITTETTISATKGVETVKLKITGMTCAGCSSHVTETLEGVKGVSKVDLEYPGDVATIEFDASKTNKEELIAAIVKINYKAEELKDTKTASTTKKSCAASCGH